MGHALDRLLVHFQEGGWGMYPVVAVLFAIVVVAVRRAVRLASTRNRLVPKKV